MTLLGALETSTVNAAQRPYYTMVPADEPAKTIISIGNLEDVYVVWTKNGNFVHALDESESYKVRGKEDWEPVGVRASEG